MFDAMVNSATRGPKQLICPTCGVQLEISTLKINDEELERTEWLLLLDCPSGDYHGTMRQQQVISMIAKASYLDDCERSSAATQLKNVVSADRVTCGSYEVRHLFG